MLTRKVDQTVGDKGRSERWIDVWMRRWPYTGREIMLIVGMYVGAHALVFATKQIAHWHPSAWFDTAITGMTIVGTLLWINRRRRERSDVSERPPIEWSTSGAILALSRKNSRASNTDSLG